MTRRSGNTLSWQLLKEVLSVYFIITIFITLAQMGIQFSHTRQMIQSELISIEKTFQPAIASALWELNTEQLEALQQGIIKLPVIARLSITSARGEKWEKKSSTPPLGTMIAHQFQVFYQFSGQNIYLADVSFETSDSAVLERLKLGYQMVFISALIKSILLTTLFFWVFHRRLGKPLSTLTQAVAAINLDHLQPQKIDLHQHQNNELTELEKAYNLMLDRLDAERLSYFSELQKVNHHLEQQVKDRTEELLRANLRLEALAHTDTLTGLANRRRFTDQAELAIAEARSSQQPLSMLMLDLDHFKHINDTYGHSLGDAVLCNFARVVSGLLDGKQLLARLGGEEFSILLPGTPLKIAEKIATQILHAVQVQKIDGSFEPITYTVSIGATVLYPAQDKYETLMKRADEALYRAKTLGRNQVQIAP